MGDDRRTTRPSATACSDHPTIRSGQVSILWFLCFSVGLTAVAVIAMTSELLNAEIVRSTFILARSPTATGSAMDGDRALAIHAVNRDDSCAFLMVTIRLHVYGRDRSIT